MNWVPPIRVTFDLEVRTLRKKALGGNHFAGMGRPGFFCFSFLEEMG